MASRPIEAVRRWLREFVQGADPTVARADYAPWAGLDLLSSSDDDLAYLEKSNAIYTCITLRSSLLASLPIQVLRRQSDGTEIPVTEGPLVDLLQKVNPAWTFRRLIEMTEQSLCLTGMGFWALARLGRTPSGAYWCPSNLVEVKRDPARFVAGYIYRPGFGAEPKPYLPEDMLWFRYANANDQYAGLAPLKPARTAADLGLSAMLSNTGIFQRGMGAAGVVTPVREDLTFSTDQVHELEQLLDKRLKGADKAHAIAVLRFAAKWERLAFTPKDAEFMGALTWSLEEICRAFRVPLDLVGGQRTYENVQAAYRAVWTHAIQPEAEFIADELNEQLVPQFGDDRVRVAFDFGSVSALQEAEDAKWARASQMIDRGVITINEWRTTEGLKPVAWGDVYWAPAGVQPIEGPAAPVPAAATEAAPRAANAPTCDCGHEHTRALPMPEKVTISDEDIERAFRRWDEVLPEVKGLLSAKPAKPRSGAARDYGDDSPWVWESDTERYRNTDTGRFIGAEGMRELRGEFKDAQKDLLVEHTRAYSDGKIDAAQWESQCRETIKTAAIDQYVAGRGGRGEMTQADWGRVGQYTREQYQYLNGMAGDLEGLSPAQREARIQMYVESTDRMFERARAAEKGIPIDRLPALPGDGSTQCLVNCQCHWEYERVEGGWECRWTLGPAEHCDDCLSRADEWNPYVIEDEEDA